MEFAIIAVAGLIVINVRGLIATGTTFPASFCYYRCIFYGTRIAYLTLPN